MQVLLTFESKRAFEYGFTDMQHVLKGLLWHANGGTPFTVNSVEIQNVYLEKVSAAEFAGAIKQCWYQDDNWVWLKLWDTDLGYGSLVTSLGEPWWRKYKNISDAGFGLTDGHFVVVQDVAYKTGMVSAYKIKWSVDSMINFSQVHFTSTALTFLYDKIEPALGSITGSFISIDGYGEGATDIHDRVFVENYTMDMTSIKVSAVDPRASLKETVVNQKYVQGEFTSPTYGTLYTAAGVVVKEGGSRYVDGARVYLFKKLLGSIFGVDENGAVQAIAFSQTTNWDVPIAGDYTAQAGGDLEVENIGSGLQITVTQEEHSGGGGSEVVEADVLKKWKGDAIGYCVGVEGQCMNGYSYNKDNFRYYRFSYGMFEPDSATMSPIEVDGETVIRNTQAVELEYDSGWRLLYRGELQTDGTYKDGEYEWVKWTDHYQQGGESQTWLLKVSAALAHGVVSGETEVDYDTAARRARVTGTFHTELLDRAAHKDWQADPTKPYAILRYLIDTYSKQSWNDTNFDDSGNNSPIKTELAKVSGHPIGICFTQPTDIMDAVGMLQNGTDTGWKFCVHNGKYTVRAMDFERVETEGAAAVLKKSDIKNIENLEPDMEGADFVTDIHIKYGKVYSESDLASDYSDEDVRAELVNIRGNDKSGTVETLLKDEDGAIAKYNTYKAFSQEYCPSIKGLQLVEQGFTKWKGFKEFDIVDTGEPTLFGEYYPRLTGMRYWFITSMEIDLKSASVKIDIRKVPNENTSN